MKAEGAGGDGKGRKVGGGVRNKGGEKKKKKGKPAADITRSVLSPPSPAPPAGPAAGLRAAAPPAAPGLSPSHLSSADPRR